MFCISEWQRREGEYRAWLPGPGIAGIYVRIPAQYPGRANSTRNHGHSSGSQVGESHPLVIGGDEGCMPCAEKPKMQNCRVYQVAISLRCSPSVNRRYMEERLCRLCKFPSEDTTRLMPSSNGGEISRYTDGGHRSRFNRCKSVSAPGLTRSGGQLITFRARSNDRLKVLIVVEDQNGSLRRS